MKRHPLTNVVLIPHDQPVKLPFHFRGKSSSVPMTREQEDTRDWLEKQWQRFYRSNSTSEMKTIGHLMCVAQTHHNPRELGKLVPQIRPRRRYQLHVVVDGDGRELYRYVVKPNGDIVTRGDVHVILERVDALLENA